jgi:hypothetical protein
MTHNRSLGNFSHKTSSIFSNTLRKFNNDNKIYETNTLRYSTGKFNDPGSNTRTVVKSASNSLLGKDFSSS